MLPLPLFVLAALMTSQDGELMEGAEGFEGFGEREGMQMGLTDGKLEQRSEWTSPVVLSFHATKLSNLNRADSARTYKVLPAVGARADGRIVRARCKMRSNTTFVDSTEIREYRFGHDHLNPTYAGSPADCCVICSLEPFCKGWTYDTPKTKRYWLDDISSPESDNKRYHFEKWAGQEYRDYPTSKRVGGRCRLWSKLGPNVAGKESWSGKQGELKIVTALAKPANTQKTAVIFRTTATAIPTPFVAKWAKQLEGIADVWVFVDNTQCSVDDACKVSVGS
jgi:hypothetical protein